MQRGRKSITLPPFIVLFFCLSIINTQATLYTDANPKAVMNLFCGTVTKYSFLWGSDRRPIVRLKNALTGKLVIENQSAKLECAKKHKRHKEYFHFNYDYTSIYMNVLFIHYLYDNLKNQRVICMATTEKGRFDVIYQDALAEGATLEEALQNLVTLDNELPKI